jgi:hypothetical protein
VAALIHVRTDAIHFYPNRDIRRDEVAQPDSSTYPPPSHQHAEVATLPRNVSKDELIRTGVSLLTGAGRCRLVLNRCLVRLNAQVPRP